MDQPFELDERLRADTIECGRMDLCCVLLMKDSRYPWFILVPQRRGVTEIHHLSQADQVQLWRESCWLSRWMEDSFAFDKLNVAALGNIVSQLHLHHVGRLVGDPAWPGPVWGHSPAVSYETSEQERLINAVAGLLGSSMQ